MPEHDAVLADIKSELRRLHEDSRSSFGAVFGKIDVLVARDTQNQVEIARVQQEQKQMTRILNGLERRVTSHGERLDTIDNLHAEERGRIKMLSAAVAGGVSVVMLFLAEVARALFHK